MHSLQRSVSKVLSNDSESRYWELSVLGLIIVFVYTSLVHQADFLVFAHAAEKLIHGINPFPDPTSKSVYSGHSYVYPTWDLMLLVPFVILPFHFGTAVFIVLSYYAYVLGVRILRGPSVIDLLVVAIATPVIISLQMGTISPFLFLGLAFLWTKRDRVISAAMVLSLVATAKLLLLPLFLYFLLTRRYRTFVFGGIFSALILGVSFAFGPISPGAYVKILVSLSTHEMPSGWSLAGIVSSIGLVHFENELVVLSAVLVLLGVAFMHFRRCGDERIVFLGAIVISLVATPIFWSSYLPILLAGLLIWPIDTMVLAVFSSLSWFLVTPDLAGAYRDIFGLLIAGLLAVGALLQYRATAPQLEKPLRGRALRKFFTGDITGRVILYLAFSTSLAVAVLAPQMLPSIVVQESMFLTFWIAVTQSGNCKLGMRAVIGSEFDGAWSSKGDAV